MGITSKVKPKLTDAAPASLSGTAANQATPAMRQYLEQKAAVPDAILLFRMGDFYETFYDDAKTLSRVLGLTLTTRGKDADQPIPLAGLPYHAADRYIARLVRAGYKVAISEQTEDAKEAKGVIRRELVRIITPGTLTDESLLDEKSDNLLAAICFSASDSGPVGLAGIELASGRFFAELVPANELADEVARLAPAEIIIAETAIDASHPLVRQIQEQSQLTMTPRPAHRFDPYLAERSLCEHFSVSTMEGFGFERFDASLCAAAALLDYLRDTQRSSLHHVLRITPRHRDGSVMIDPFTLRSLEIDRTLREGAREGSLLGAVDQTSTPMGARRLRQWLCFPLSRVPEIQLRQDAIAQLKQRPDSLRSLCELLANMADVERILARLGVGRANPRDLVGLARTIRRCTQASTLLGQLALAPDALIPTPHAATTALFPQIARALADCDPLADELLSALKEDAPIIVRDGNFIADGYHAELDRLRQIGRDGHSSLAEFQAREIQRTGITTLKVGYNSVFGYYIEITHQHRDKVPADYVRKQTVRNAERYVTDELKRQESEILGASDRARLLELQIFDDLRARLLPHMDRLQQLADALANLDVLCGLAELSRHRRYTRPQFVSDETGGILEIIDGRHPVLDATLAERFVPNDCRMTPEGDQLLIITGPNMAGKSTYIRQIALLTLLAHTGSDVPAQSMRLSPIDRLFARVGASDELTRGQSTFMVEMVETARILNNATSHSLVILDEIGRGTSTYDGLSIAWAVTEHLAEKMHCRTLFATHYHELTELAGQIKGIANYNVAVKEELRPKDAGRGVVFLHRIVAGPADRSYGVHVAAMAGLPARVLHRSEAVLKQLESQGSEPTARTRRRAPRSEALDTLPLFSQPAIPEWCKNLIDQLSAIEANRTTPLDALALLGRLQAMLPDEKP